MFIVVIFLSFVAVLSLFIEVINPHSFLNSTGAFVRAGTILMGVPVWLWLSKRRRRVLVTGSIVLTVTAIIYGLYGINTLCYELFYAKHKDVGRFEEPYSCGNMIYDRLFK
jgi:hypothetical protein